LKLAFVHCASRSESLRPLSPVHGPRQRDQRRAVLPVLRKLGSQELGAPRRAYLSAPTPPGPRLMPRWRFVGAASAHCAKPAKDAPGRGHSDRTRPRMHSRLGQGTCLDPWRAAPTPGSPGPSCRAGGVFGAAAGNGHCDSIAETDTLIPIPFPRIFLAFLLPREYRPHYCTSHSYLLPHEYRIYTRISTTLLHIPL